MSDEELRSRIEMSDPYLRSGVEAFFAMLYAGDEKSVAWDRDVDQVLVGDEFHPRLWTTDFYILVYLGDPMRAMTGRFVWRDKWSEWRWITSQNIPEEPYARLHTKSSLP